MLRQGSIIATMVVEPLRFEASGGVSRFAAEMRSEQAVRSPALIQFNFLADVDPPQPLGDAWLAALIVPAMFVGESLEIRAPVSKRLTRTVQEFQRMFHSWFPELFQIVQVIIPETVPTSAERDDGPAATFFSCGVDSWYSALTHLNELRALITVKGFDMPFNDQVVWPLTVRGVSEAASELGLQSIKVETNIRDHADASFGVFKRKYEKNNFWGTYFHGVCLDAVALFLQEQFARVYVPASWHYPRLQAWGAHPLIDTYLSSGRVQIVHDGADAARADKIRAISKVPAALRLLRVCAAYTRGQYNCGVCEKCRRTMFALRAVGVDVSQVPFNAPLNLRALEQKPPKPYLYPIYQEIADEAAKRGDTELVECIRMLTSGSPSVRREWHRWNTRMRRSVMKRWHRLRKPRNPSAGEGHQ